MQEERVGEDPTLRLAGGSRAWAGCRGVGAAWRAGERVSAEPGAGGEHGDGGTVLCLDHERRAHANGNAVA